MIKKIFKFLILIVITYYGSWLIGYWSINNFAQPIGFLFSWQQLAGSFLGALTPIGLFLITEEYQRRKKQKGHLILLEKSIISAINNLADVDKMLHAFSSTALSAIKLRVEEDDRAGRYSVGQAFIPLSETFSFDKEIMKDSTNSSYLENLKLKVLSTSHDFPLMLKDISRQFDRTITLNIQLGTGKLNSANVHNKMFLENLEEFKKVLLIQTFGHNIPIYLRQLVSVLIPLRSMNTWGLRKWKRIFPFPSPFSEETVEKMSEYFKPEVNTFIEKLQESFESKLLLVDKKSLID